MMNSAGNYAVANQRKRVPMKTVSGTNQSKAMVMSRSGFSSLMLVGLCILTPLAGMAFAEQTATESTNNPALFMKHTGGWGAGVLAEFTLEKDGTFHWQTKKENKHTTGSIPRDEMKQLIKDVSSAGAGPAAEDAGYVEFKWVDDDGKKGSQDYNLPRQAPCQRLLKKIEELVGKYGKPNAEQGGGTLRR